MGDVFWGLHAPIAANLIKAQDLRVAVETGSHFGFGALQLAAMVDDVWTVESDSGLHEFCKATYDKVDRIRFFQGESDVILGRYVAQMDQPTLFVLDAHWFPMSPRAAERPGNLCPVLEELRVLSSAPSTLLAGSAVIVDDAQMFLGSLKTPFVRNALPSITEILKLVDRAFDCTVVTDDVIVGCNNEGSRAIDEYLRWRDRLQFP
ncbi:MAG: hypothetical protein J2P37_29865 [Ktedonobacteraceae bacterium]|nr:hypothetical protein [Ktedonobacteraceae bacterium]